MKIVFQFDDNTQTALNPEAVQIYNVQDKKNKISMAAVGYKAGEQMVPVLFFSGTFFNPKDLADYTAKVKKEARNNPRNNKIK
jgi:hypothetical protein